MIDSSHLRRAFICLAIASTLWPMAHLSAVIGVALCGVGHGPETGLGEKLIVTSFPLFGLAAASFVTAVVNCWKGFSRRWPVVLLIFAGLINLLAEAHSFSWLL
ncbi:hypothetical protein Pan44_54260 [Caulifigura coniformis]|uniref:Uncharacterized protein n=1 Tax=Caulifigura coniformis TaxID=2527983 RepID=A0A517SMK4_9PLAN|nr:hypothetical protein [Caulifigura coniformis]QDT57357.1 hypothetical protein Pan44_54260 [Caulifigura coniformis]